MGPFELLILLFVIFLVVGPKRLTAIFRSLGRGARDFTEELGRDKSADAEKRELTEEDDKPQSKE